MNILRLRFSNHEQADLVLAPGVHAIGRDGGGTPCLVGDAATAIAQFCVDRRGVWLQVREGTRGLHVNGRSVRRMAMLRPGDAVYVDGVELMLLGPPPLPAPDDDSGASVQDAHMVLRGIGGQNHGRSLTLDRPRMVGRLRECDIWINEPAFAERHARLEPHADGVVLRDLGSESGSVVNGHPVRHALLRPGDQVVFEAQHRFVVEAPVAVAMASDLPAGSGGRPPIAPVAEAPADPGAVRATARRIPWLLLAALLLAGALSLLLIYGVR
ncbi:MAG: FHA domain-containing protein [Proteobacteria bacterium]|nr:FHA domain-containing protein [Pseudomonadota bacterium]